MKKTVTFLFFTASLFCFAAADPVTINPVTINPQTLQHVPPAGTYRYDNNKVTGGYGASTVQTKLNVDVKENTGAVHFIRDTSDPYVVSKAYLIRNADPFILRGVLKSIVAGSIQNSPVSIESVKYNDGLGVIMVSAEEYRFKDAGNGMSIDQLVAALDRKNLPNSSGTIDMAYFPKYNPASRLLPMLKESGIGFNGTAAISVIKSNSEESNAAANIGGGLLGLRQYHYARVDEDMNAIVMTAPGFDMHDALAFLKEIDKPQKEIHLTYKLVEIYAENDQKLGMDFQSWKNNDGLDLFSVGGKYGRNNWNSTLFPNLGSTSMSYVNFNPKWNTKYIDFLTTCGKASITTSGKMIIAHEGVANLALSNGLFTVAIQKVESEKNVADLMPKVNKYAKGGYVSYFAELLANGIIDFLKQQKTPQGNTQEIKEAGDHTFLLTLGGDIHNSASNLDVAMSSMSLIGWDGNGNPRLTTSKYNTKIQITANKQDFVIGGITKSSVVRSVNGLPFLKDLPVLGWLFSTESDIVKKSQYVLIASAELVTPDTPMSAADKANAGEIQKRIDKAVRKPASITGFQQLLLDTKELK